MQFRSSQCSLLSLALFFSSFPPVLYYNVYVALSLSHSLPLSTNQPTHHAYIIHRCRNEAKAEIPHAITPAAAAAIPTPVTRYLSSFVRCCPLPTTRPLGDPFRLLLLLLLLLLLWLLLLLLFRLLGGCCCCCGCFLGVPPFVSSVCCCCSSDSDTSLELERMSPSICGSKRRGAQKGVRMSDGDNQINAIVAAHSIARGANGKATHGAIIA